MTKATIDPNSLPSADILSKDEIEDLLPSLDALIEWAKQVQEHALNEALKGVKFAGFKIVEGRSIRKFSDETKVVNALVAEGIDEALLYEKKLLTLPNIEKLVGKKTFTELLAPYVTVPPEFTPQGSAAAEFDAI